jgi:hypothetical protein
MTDATPLPYIKPWYTSRTIWSASISALCAILSLVGHNIDAGAQAQLVDALVNIANGASVIAGLAAAYYRTKATKSIQ